ncbi:hypothetical protein [Paracoccus sp. PAR01]|uniref:hypothetical protein n=1 Tax=Paracoccus sp. PAR01 TaxID=2769282 RepID=UPI001785AD94|nr:hypothetical protein [Paracoccus sp. PAR01]MBD9529436.1 hypothetical protein [Paracoccus sp. PAR01]
MSRAGSEWDETRITFGKGRNTGFAIDRIQPDPEKRSLGYPTHVMRFTAQAANPSKVRISTRPMHFGWTRALMAKMEALASYLYHRRKMDSVVRGVAIYTILLIITRLSGRSTLAQAETR